MAQEPSRVERLVAALAYEYQCELNNQQSRPRRQRPQPQQFVDLTPYAHLSSKQVARELGVTGTDVEYVAGWIADERAGLLHPPEGRCEAGTKRWGGLRCYRPALPDQRWCGHHHPDPPERTVPPARLSPWDLAARPDGALLQAVYDLADQQRDLARHIGIVLNRLDRAEQRQEQNGPELLTVQQAAELLSVSTRTIHAMCKAHRLPWLRVGRQYRFRARDLDTWLAELAIRPLR